MISVIMPVFNAERTIRQAILSATRNQGNVKSEIIVVDDGSTDRTPDILRKLQAEMPLRVIRQANAGPGAARNTALKQARGDLIAFLDADDYFVPMALEHMQACMQKHSVSACVAGTQYLLGSIPTSSGIECWHKLDKDVVNVWEDNFLVEITPGVRAKMFKRELLTDLMFSGSKWEDLAFIPAALARAGKVAILNESAYNYRIHLNTTVKDFLFRCNVEDILVALEVLEQNLQSAMTDEPQAQTYRSILTLHTVFRMQNVITWLGVSRTEKRQIIQALAAQLTAKHPSWREDAVLCDPEFGYKDPFFRMMLGKLYKNYLD